MLPPAGFVDRSAEAGDRACRIWIADDFASLPSESLWAAGRPLGAVTGAGRGAVAVLDVTSPIRGEVQLVARDLRRGGLFGKLLGWRFRSPRRVFGELDVTARLRAASVPCVEPAAAVACRRGGAWQLRLLTVRLDDVLPWPAFVAARPELRSASTFAVGATLRKAFAAGLLHADLHPENLLLRVSAGSEVECVLVDLDRAKLVEAPTPDAACDAMLLRMLRFMYKHAARLPVRAERADQLRLLAALGQDAPRRRRTWQRLAPQLQAILARRRGRYENLPIRPR